jgi:oligosaccharide repeat unit polymerase
MNWPLVLGASALAMLAVWISHRRFAHPVSPFSAYYVAWFLSLALYGAGWIAYTPVRASTWMLIALSLAAFGAGWSIPYLAWDARGVRDAAELCRAISEEKLYQAIRFCFLLGAIGLAVFLYSVHSTLGLAEYIEAPHEIRQAMAAGGEVNEGIKPFNWLNVSNVVLASLYLFALHGRRRLQVWFVLGFSVAAVLLMEDRTRFFYATLWAGFLLSFSMKMQAKKIFAGLGVVSLLLLAQFVAVAAWLGKVAENSPVLMESAHAGGASLALLPPYMYATSSFPALQAYLDTAPRATHGAMTFYPLFKLLKLVDPTLESPAIVADFVSVPFEANTFTWLHQFYTDFGVAGVLIGPLLAGLLASALYFHMLRTRTFYSTYATALLCFCLTLSILVNHLTQGPAWFFLAVGAAIAVCIRAPRTVLDTAKGETA